KRGSLVVISDTANPAPSRLHSSRNGLSVTPAIGARITFGSMACGPMRMQALSQQRRTRASERPASGARMDMTSLDPRLRGDDGEEGLKRSSGKAINHGLAADNALQGRAWGRTSPMQMEPQAAAGVLLVPTPVIPEKAGIQCLAINRPGDKPVWALDRFALCRDAVHSKQG